jgi:secreted trypsin-like serine protease
LLSVIKSQMRRKSSITSCRILEYSIVALLSLQVSTSGEIPNDYIRTETRNDCYYKRDGACLNANNPQCEVYGGRIINRGCPPGYVCCLPQKDAAPVVQAADGTKMTCGFTMNLDSGNRVMGGWAADPFEWPFVVSLKFDNSPECGGAIIDSRWILTAAHCFPQDLMDKTFWSVTVSEDDLLRVEIENQFMEIEEIFPHPKYLENSHHHDIALLKLTADIQYTDAARPICLPDVTSNFTGKVCVVAGWGRSGDNEGPSQYMQMLNAPIFQERICLAAYGDKYYEHNYCAGYGENGRDSCKGDSGGPLMCHVKVADKKQWFVAGVVSWGEKCGNPKYPGIYTKVSSFLPWIKQIMEDNK